MKVGIIGAGNVGAATAYALVLMGAARHVVLHDKDAGLAAAQAEDILHATPMSKTARIEHGPMESLCDSDVVILACGVSSLPGETRLHCLERNVAVFKDVVPHLTRVAPNAIILVATNPVDVMTQWVTKISGYDPSRVIGSGTILDTARFRALLAEHFDLSPHSVHAYVLGEHGDSEVLAWSSARIGGLSLDEFAAMCAKPLDAAARNRIDDNTRRAAYKIIRGKGATWFGVAAGLARIVRAIRDDERVVLTVSMLTAGWVEDRDVALSLPRVIGRNGVIRDLEPALSEAETAELLRSAAILDQAARSVGT